MSHPSPPTDLICDLMSQPQKTLTENPYPRFGWTFNDGEQVTSQTAYQIRMWAGNEEPPGGKKDVFWDSGKVRSKRSVNVPYEGPRLVENTSYRYQVRAWNQEDSVSEWSHPQTFRTGKFQSHYTTPGYPLEREEIPPVRMEKTAGGKYFFDFGRAVFGKVRFRVRNVSADKEIVCHLGEKLQRDCVIDRTPPGNVRYKRIPVSLQPDREVYEVEIPAAPSNTTLRTIRMPEEIGEVLPFRYCEIGNCPPGFEPESVRQVAVHYPFDDEAAKFSCSNQLLNNIWSLCKHTIKATTFCGLYVDGDRERYPREGDAYINMLGHYCVDREFTLARHTHEFMMTHTSHWTEWILQSVFMAWQDYIHTGDLRSAKLWYEDLKAKTLLDLSRPDGLISSRTGKVTDELQKRIHHYEGDHVRREELHDIVDWPGAGFGDDEPGERDGFEFCPINTVVNAFHYRALVFMSRLAEALGDFKDAQFFGRRAARIKRTINRHLFDVDGQRYVDGEGSQHASLHANLFPLAFGLVPPDRIPGVVQHIKSRGMKCSVYGAQHLLDALYRVGEADYALELLTATHDRSWGHMVEEDATMTWEAWDWKFKNNLDWNHAWGAAPANLIPRRLMGIRPLTAGFGRILLQPQPASLQQATLQLPTIRGPVEMQLENQGNVFRMEVEIPGNTTARAELPARAREVQRVQLDGTRRKVRREAGRAVIDPVPAGRHDIEMIVNRS